MADNNIKSATPNVLFLKFEDSKLPLFKEVASKEWTQFGEDDLYPEYLLLLSNKSAKHNAIINGKVNYIFGNGLQTQSGNPDFATWIKKCNSFNEGMDDITIKAIKDCEVFGGFYWFIIPNIAGEIVDIHHLDFNKIRTNKDRDTFYYKEKWNDRKEEVKKYPRYSPGLTVSSVFSFREYRQGQGAYPLPNYISAINYIESDYEVSKQTLSNAKTGFSASKFINFYNGEPDEEQKKEIQRRFDNKLTGSDGKKIVIGFNNDPAKKPTIEDLGNSDLSKEDFTAVDNLITSNIYAGHQITSPMLFGIQESGKLGSGNELKFAYDIFKNTYVNFKQKQIEAVINYFAEIRFGVAGDFKLQDVDPIGIPLSDQTIMQFAPKAWIWKKLGINPADYPNDLPAIDINKGNDPKTAAPAAAEQMVNDNIKNLTAKQHQQLTRIIRQYSKGQLTKQAATTLLKTGLGLSDVDVAAMLGFDDNEQQFSLEYSEEEVADMFEQVGTSKQSFDIVRTKAAKFTEDEFTFQECFDAADDAEASTVNEVGKPIVKKGTNILPEISIKYSYEVKPGAGAEIIQGSRAFCRKLISLNRLYTRSDIQQISMRVGYSVWERKGGFWNMGHGETSPSCRHIWQSHIVIKKKL